MLDNLKELLLNFHAPGRRYSYYPALPSWKHKFTQDEVLSSMNLKEVDLYIHLPFCENLCTFCGCNIKVTKDRSQFKDYIDLILKEWKEYQTLSNELVINSIYLGGGTPTYLNETELNYLMEGIFKNVKVSENFKGTVESDPRVDQKLQLRALANYGFKNISLGVQDLDERTLSNVNRHQHTTDIFKTINTAREENFEFINIDLIYGLPFQTKKSFENTATKILELAPTSISNYPLAKVPWQTGPQNAYGIYEPLNVSEMYDLYILADDIFHSSGFSLLGMGHYSNLQEKQFRNIMGYTTNKTVDLLGLGVSSLSNVGDILFQREKILEKYMYNPFAEVIGHRKSEKEIRLEQLFHQVTCDHIITKSSLAKVIEEESLEKLEKTFSYLTNNGLLIDDKESYAISKDGKHFLRTICQTIENFS